jgi:hypothetical protein
MPNRVVLKCEVEENENISLWANINRRPCRIYEQVEGRKELPDMRA